MITVKTQLPLTGEQEEWFKGQVERNKLDLVSRGTNPCVALFGAHSGARTCKFCVHLVRIQKGKVYLKCDLRKMTSGAGTDHKAGWPACGRFEDYKAK